MEIWEKIQKERETNGKFTSLEDFIRRCYTIINKKSFEWLVKSGWLDAFGDRKTLLENQETILQRAKSSPTMSGGLFGFSEETSKITFKNTYTTEIMEKLMMEQEVFKSFVSWNPLDGLYVYLKKYSFISQFKGKDNVTGPFVFVGYVKNIQRAKKKWFFMAIEDISGTVEFFMRETSDLKKFDILIITGFKGRWLSIEKIVRTSREKLIQQAGGKYDPEMTVVKAKLLRTWLDKPVYDLPDLPTSSFIPTESDSIQDFELEWIGWEIEEQILEETIPEIPEITEFAIPDTMDKINTLRELLRSYPWDVEVIIGWGKYMVTPEWEQKIVALLS